MTFSVERGSQNGAQGWASVGGFTQEGRGVCSVCVSVLPGVGPLFIPGDPVLSAIGAHPHHRPLRARDASLQLTGLSNPQSTNALVAISGVVHVRQEVETSWVLLVLLPG